MWPGRWRDGETTGDVESTDDVESCRPLLPLALTRER